VFEHASNYSSTCGCYQNVTISIRQIGTGTSTAVDQLITLVPGDYQNTFPAVSPDGTKIAFTSNLYANNLTTYDYHHELYVMNSDGSGLRRLTANSIPANQAGNFNDYWPTWSPDGQWIAFQRSYYADSNHPNPEIWKIQVDGPDPATQVSQDSSKTYFQPQWSPNGTKIAFARGESGGSYFSCFGVMRRGGVR
jgi:Tol biopolymer transport system component